jgi:hypothetical protein
MVARLPQAVELILVVGLSGQVECRVSHRIKPVGPAGVPRHGNLDLLVVAVESRRGLIAGSGEDDSVTGLVVDEAELAVHDRAAVPHDPYADGEVSLANEPPQHREPLRDERILRFDESGEEPRLERGCVTSFEHRVHVGTFKLLVDDQADRRARRRLPEVQQMLDQLAEARRRGRERSRVEVRAATVVAPRRLQCRDVELVEQGVVGSAQEPSPEPFRVLVPHLSPRRCRRRRARRRHPRRPRRARRHRRGRHPRV